VARIDCVAVDAQISVSVESASSSFFIGHQINVALLNLCPVATTPYQDVRFRDCRQLGLPQRANERAHEGKQKLLRFYYVSPDTKKEAANASA
jgi:hypothetical protein